MKTQFDLAKLDWTLAGFMPWFWKFTPTPDIRSAVGAEIRAIPAQIPGSVQGALRAAGLLPDWNSGLHYRECEWVENRHWIYQADLPDDWLPAQKSGALVRLHCAGLDDRGWIYLNGAEIGRFENAHLPYTFDLGSALLPTGNRLWLVFDTPPRWLGQIGYTSQMTDWKPRYYYTWDWTARLVQVGIWDTLSLEVASGGEIADLQVSAWLDRTGTGSLRMRADLKISADLRLQANLEGPGGRVRTAELPAQAFQISGLDWEGLPVEAWWPNGMGSRPLYTLTIRLVSPDGTIHDQVSHRVGFKKADWLACAGAPLEADPWICAINGQAVFLQGFNWTPIRPNFADVTDDEYRQRLELYQKLGVNILRVWGGGFIEKEIFYRLCDELGILVWQEFLLSSSGVDNWPPEDEASITAMAAIARSAIHRRQQHACLLAWCGGNELQGELSGSKIGVGKPVDATHPLIGRLEEVVHAEDPGRRFLVTSPSGPRSSASREEFGLGLHWDVHGPWKADPIRADWESYWRDMDALFHSEVGAPGASPAEIIRRFSGGLPEMPATIDNPLWWRTSWWIEWPEFLGEMGREPADLEEFVAWSQARQTWALTTVAETLKSKFPRCGGVIFWMGHDSFPCTTNTSVIDFDGQPKPAALALQAIFLRK
jgi:beta-mannosidase